MNIIRLTSKFIIRRKFKSSISIAASLILALFMTIYSHSLYTQIETMNDFYEKIDVAATLTTSDGGSTENLYVNEEIINTIEQSGFVKEKFYTRKLIVLTGEPPNTYDDIVDPVLREFFRSLDRMYDNPPTLIGINNFTTITEFAPDIYETAIFLDGYDKKFFQSNENAIMVNDIFLEKMELELGDEVTFRVVVPSKDEEDESQAHGELVITLKIVAKHQTYRENHPMYVPWSTMEQIYLDKGSSLMWDSARFTLQNTKDLDKFKNLLTLEGFNYPGQDPEEIDYEMPGMFVNDRILASTTSSVSDTVDFMRILYPFIYILCAGIGFLVSYLLIRIRKPEYAIMRSMGTSRLTTFMCFLLEQIFLSTIGVAISLSITLIISGNITDFQLYSVLGYICFYWIGTSIAILMMNSGNVIQILTSKE